MEGRFHQNKSQPAGLCGEPPLDEVPLPDNSAKSQALPQIEDWLAFYKFAGLIQVIEHGHVRIDAQGIIDRSEQVVRMHGLFFR